MMGITFAYVTWLNDNVQHNHGCELMYVCIFVKYINKPVLNLESILHVEIPCTLQSVKWVGSTLIARFMGSTWGLSRADKTQVGPMLAPWTLLSGNAIWADLLSIFHNTLGKLLESVVRNYCSVSKILNLTGFRKLPQYESSYCGLPCGEIVK